MDIEEVGKWQIRPLGEGDTISAFTCGDSDIDDYITNESVLYQVEQAVLTCTCGGNECLTQKFKSMARPIEETPILRGEDARRFLQRMKENRRVTREEFEDIKQTYEKIEAIFEHN